MKLVLAVKVLTMSHWRRNKMMKKIIAAVVLSAMTLFALPNNEVELMIIAKAVEKKAVVLASMELNGEKKEAFGNLYEHYQVRLMELRMQELKLISDYAEHYLEMTEVNADKIIIDYIGIEEKALKLKKRYIIKFQEFLSSAEVIRYFQIENRYKLLEKSKVAEAIPLAIPGSN